MIQAIHRDDQADGQAMKIKLLQTTSTSAATLHMNRSFLHLLKAVQNYAGTIELQYGVPFAEVYIKGVVEIMMPFPYLQRQLSPLYFRYVRSGQQVTNNCRPVAAVGVPESGWRHWKRARDIASE